MKKTVSYKVDTSLTKDGVVSESQCECAAGQGPAAHCKHVITALRYCCILQGWRALDRSDMHSGSPLKLKNFHEATGKESGHKLYDPRTNAVNKDKIRKRHRDVIINWPEKPARLAVMQLFPPANRKAVRSDHQGLYIPGRLMGVARPDSPPKRDVKCTSNSVSCLSRQKTSTAKENNEDSLHRELSISAMLCATLNVEADPDCICDDKESEEMNLADMAEKEGLLYFGGF
ncbi:hypothetical protein Pmani_010224 [Petrolisthes manimaculis]|uniref:SWIM-type domain-containing protein n=1 Tax=Petrolisthes manimaculis TaxID=1843537 RepID=A0AAE1UFU2_9EUCA|nr:hypothetical protein Pmani_010224 [Petrolisthes manimaculis]